jgi:hypothetical protein
MLLLVTSRKVILASSTKPVPGFSVERMQNYIKAANP